MKIIMDINEVRSLVADRVNCDFDLEIKGTGANALTNTPLAGFDFRAIKTIAGIVEAKNGRGPFWDDFASHEYRFNKIAAIKHLREAFREADAYGKTWNTLGLAESKHFVENVYANA